MFVLEPAQTARRRSAHVYAEVAGCGASSDAHHMVIPSPDPEPAIAAMRLALVDACLEPSSIDYINAHATSTPVGDVAETHVLEAVLEDGVRTVPVSSTKSMTGHCLTAAAAVEALTCLIAMDRQAVPPTINLDDPDPECNLCHVPNQARPQAIRVAVSNSFGFGGSNTLFGQTLEWIGAVAQPGLCKAQSRRIVKEDSILFAGPYRISLKQARPTKLEEESTRLSGAQNHRLMKRRLMRVESVMTTKRLMNMKA
jgi:hypothetical protein